MGRERFLKTILIIVVIVSIFVVVSDRINALPSPHHQGIYEKYVKRVQDFWCAVAALVILSPVMVVTAALVWVKLGSPVFFKQKRPGKDEKIFEMWKFRTMTDEKDEAGNILPDEVRLTSFGRILRATSLDELPEIFNIIKGDMAVVGPRPLLVKYLPRYSEKQRHRHDVRPGLTGLAQVSGRNGISWEEKFEDDLEYVSNIRFLSDWKIIFRTVRTVVRHDGINSAESVTMEEFLGSGEKEAYKTGNVLQKKAEQNVPVE